MVLTARAIGWVLLGALASSGCFGAAQAKTVPEQPLDMPEPPPRHVEATQPVLPPALTLPGELVPEPPVLPTPPPAQRVDAPRPAEPPRPGTPPAEPPKPVEEGVKPVPAPPSTLQTASAQREVEVEKRIRTQLSQATSNLNRIDYRALNADARTQYDIAKRFVAQAEDALRGKNLVFANNLADKAAALAVQLVSRR